VTSSFIISYAFFAFFHLGKKGLIVVVLTFSKPNNIHLYVCDFELDGKECQILVVTFWKDLSKSYEEQVHY
jgi:hypothetical protein